MNLDKSVLCPVLIGRENDLQLLDHLIAQSQGASGQIALISGEAGIGKSRYACRGDVGTSALKIIPGTERDAAGSGAVRSATP